MCFIPRVPGLDEKDTAGEEAGFKYAEQGAQGSELSPGTDEAHGEHNQAPADGDARNDGAGTNLGQQDVGGDFEEDVRYLGCC